MRVRLTGWQVDRLIDSCWGKNGKTKKKQCERQCRQCRQLYVCKHRHHYYSILHSNTNSNSAKRWITSRWYCSTRLHSWVFEPCALERFLASGLWTQGNLNVCSRSNISRKNWNHETHTHLLTDILMSTVCAVFPAELRSIHSCTKNINLLVGALLPIWKPLNFWL